MAVKAGQSVTEAELIEFVKQRVAAYKYPRTVEFRDSLPKGATGKILKKELRPSRLRRDRPGVRRRSSCR